jgi:hypothetical protein
MEMLFAKAVDKQSSGIVAAVLTVIALTILDAFLTLDLVSRGASELNPIMAFYLTQGPTPFIVVKYLLTSASLFLLLTLKDKTWFRGKISAPSLILIHILLLGLVVHKQVCMKLGIF